MKQMKDDKGSASLEASIAVPIFVFAMVYLYLVLQSVLAEAVVYEAAAETVEYMAEYSYVDICNLAVARLRFPNYVDEEDTLERYVKEGTDGVSFLGSTMLDADDYVILRVRFQPRFAGEQSFEIRKRAYTGEKTEDGDEEADETPEVYVYVTDNREVYHTTRSCSYLALSIQPASKTYAENHGYHACAFCGDACGEAVYITEEGESYHSDRSCSGLKRTVYRKKKSELGDLPACSRCGRK